jgi:hypothetical protein
MQRNKFFLTLIVLLSALMPAWIAVDAITLKGGIDGSNSQPPSSSLSPLMSQINLKVLQGRIDSGEAKTPQAVSYSTGINYDENIVDAKGGTIIIRWNAWVDRLMHQVSVNAIQYFATWGYRPLVPSITSYRCTATVYRNGDIKLSDTKLRPIYEHGFRAGTEHAYETLQHIRWYTEFPQGSQRDSISIPAIWVPHNTNWKATGYDETISQ